MWTFAGRYLRKGRQMFAEGRIKTSAWTDSAGQKHYRTEILVDDLGGLGQKPDIEEAA